MVLGCWDENSEVVNWMKEHGIPDSTALLQYFEDQVTPLAPENSVTLHFLNHEPNRKDLNLGCCYREGLCTGRM